MFKWFWRSAVVVYFVMLMVWFRPLLNPAYINLAFAAIIGNAMWLGGIGWA